MTEHERILITGFMGAGKTAAASALARLLDCEMVDLDRLVSEREGRSIQAIIEADGEAQFRRAETSALRAALDEGRAQVIALGGGTWTLESNRLLIRAHAGRAIWLDTPFELCWSRINADGAAAVRPLARDRQQALRLYEERRIVYGLAMLRIEGCDGKSVEEIAAEMATALRRR